MHFLQISKLNPKKKRTAEFDYRFTFVYDRLGTIWEHVYVFAVDDINGAYMYKATSANPKKPLEGTLKNLCKPERPMTVTIQGMFNNNREIILDCKAIGNKLPRQQKIRWYTDKNQQRQMVIEGEKKNTIIETVKAVKINRPNPLQWFFHCSSKCYDINKLKKQ